MKSFSAKLIEMCEVAANGKKHSTVLKQKSMAVIAVMERRREGGERRGKTGSIKYSEVDVHWG